MTFPTFKQFTKLKKEDKRELISEISDWEFTGVIATDGTWDSIRSDEDDYLDRAEQLDIYADLVSAYERTVMRSIVNNIPERVKLRYAKKDEHTCLKKIKKLRLFIEQAEIEEEL